MATVSTLKPIPHTRIENSVIDDYLPQIGAYGFSVYIVIKRHQNQKTLRCDPSYATIARKIGIDRSTVIRHVHKLKALGLLSPALRFKEDGRPTSNQYNFASSPNAQEHPEKELRGGGTEPLPIVAENNQDSGTDQPEQMSENKHMEIIQQDQAKEETPTMTKTASTPARTLRQQTCPHPSYEIASLSGGIVLCNRCYGLLDDGGTTAPCGDTDGKTIEGGIQTVDPFAA
jgi:hypothetical protein